MTYPIPERTASIRCHQHNPRGGRLCFVSHPLTGCIRHCTPFHLRFCVSVCKGLPSMWKRTKEWKLVHEGVVLRMCSPYVHCYVLIWQWRTAWCENSLCSCPGRRWCDWGHTSQPIGRLFCPSDERYETILLDTDTSECHHVHEAFGWCDLTGHMQSLPECYGLQECNSAS